MTNLDIKVSEPMASAPAGFLRVTPNVDEVSDELLAIVMQHLPTFLRQFAAKNAEYGGGAAFELGVRGQYSDIHRKMIKLKRFMWDHPDLDPEFEDLPEIIRDLIGHLFMTLEMFRRMEQKEKGVGQNNALDNRIYSVFPDGFVLKEGIFIDNRDPHLRYTQSQVLEMINNLPTAGFDPHRPN